MQSFPVDTSLRTPTKPEISADSALEVKDSFDGSGSLNFPSISVSDCSTRPTSVEKQPALREVGNVPSEDECMSSISDYDFEPGVSASQPNLLFSNSNIRNSSHRRSIRCRTSTAICTICNFNF